MSETKHTLGPWSVVPDIREERGEEYLAGYDIHGADGTEIVGCEGIRAGGNAEMDARLISAAPCMLSAITRQIENIERWIVSAIPASPVESKQIYDQLVAARDKAEGRISE